MKEIPGIKYTVRLYFYNGGDAARRYFSSEDSHIIPWLSPLKSIPCKSQKKRAGKKQVRQHNARTAVRIISVRKGTVLLHGYTLPGRIGCCLSSAELGQMNGGRATRKSDYCTYNTVLLYLPAEAIRWKNIHLQRKYSLEGAVLFQYFYNERRDDYTFTTNGGICRRIRLQR